MIRARNWPWSVVLIVLVAVFTLGVATAPSISRMLVSPAQAAAAVYDRDTIANVAETAAPSVVGVTARMSPAKKGSSKNESEEFFKHFAPGPSDPDGSTPRSFGTGFVFRQDGYILTNAHVIEGAAQVEVTLQDGTRLPAKIVGQSNLLDLAVLKVDSPKPLPVLNLGDSSRIRPGEWVIAIGNPLGYDHTVTAGVLSAMGRRVQAGGDQSQQTRLYEDLLQTDAAINPGNSGGPLLNLDGRVIGINAVMSAVGQGIGFAIPIDSAKEALDQLIKTGRYVRPWLGVGVVDLAAVDESTRQKYQIAQTEGVFIVQVYRSSPAERAGLVEGDAIVAMDGKAVKNTDALQAVVRSHKVGDSLRLTVIHRGRSLPFDLILGEQPDE